MYDAYGDGELITLARKTRDVSIRAELWQRADTDAEYRGDMELTAQLERHGLKRPVTQPGGALK